MKRARLLAFVLTAAMATTVFLGGTVARYQTSAGIDDTATVAKWGVKLTMAGNLFDEKYKTGLVANSTPVVSGDFSVSSSEAADRVAPGTSGDTLKIKLTGSTEVDIKLKATIVAQDIYLKASQTFAVLQSVGTLTETEYNSMMAVSGDENKLYTLSGTTVDKAAGWVDSKTYYVLQNRTTLDSNGYYPVKYSATGSLEATDVDITTIAQELADEIKGGTVTPDTDEVFAKATYTNVTSVLVKANTDLTWVASINENGYKLNDINLDWKWVIDGNNDADTILGAISSGEIVVMLTGGTTYTTLVKDAQGVVYSGTIAPANEVGSVQTLFDIELTVSQED